MLVEDTDNSSSLEEDKNEGNKLIKILITNFNQ